MADQLVGWRVPLRKGLAEPLLLGGVSYGFLLTDAFSTFLLTIVTQQWRLPLVGLAAYVGGVALTKWEPSWLRILTAYWRYKAYYEG